MLNLDDTMNIIENPNETVLQEIYRFRARVWMQEGAKPNPKKSKAWRNDGETWLMHDDEDNKAYHVAIYHHNKIIASARIVIYDCLEDMPDLNYFNEKPIEPINKYKGKIGQWTRVAVLSEYRRKGLCKLLSQKGLAYAKQENCQCVVSIASPAHRTYLSSIGFQILSPREFSYPTAMEDMPWSFMLLEL